MRKFVVFALAVGLFVVALILPPLTGAKRADKTRRQVSQQKMRVDYASKLTPQTSRAVNFAVTPTVREIAANQRAPQPFKYRRPLSKKEYRDEQQNKYGKPNIPLTDDQEAEREKNRANRTPIRQFDETAPVLPDGALYKGRQDSGRTPLIPGTSVNFEGQSIFDTITLGQGFLPPDTVGDVGPNHYVQMVNSTFRIWDKTGMPSIPVTSIGALFATIPGPCANSEDGDPIVLYDSLADRWLLSEFCTVANPNNHQLIAISQTADPTGAYYLYDFMMPNNKFNDYPKFGVWPDGYYMTDNQFNQAGTAFLGGGVFAFDRAKMLAGDPTASFIYFDLEPLDPSIGGMLPSDADGLTPPPAGAPNVFAYFIATEVGDASDGLRLFNFHADFAVPANSTFTERAGSPLAVAAFDPRAPAGRDQIEQPPPANNATSALDAISDRLMHRLQYRNFGTHESLIASHTVNVGTGTTLALHQAGVRYYELRKTGGGAYAVNEQATFSPDTVNRWMPSAAMDRQGNIAVGYSVSNDSVFPGMRYAGRLAGDPPNGLPQGEAVLQAGNFVQTHTASRWGDYSSLNVDPVDDCTFWNTNEYYLDDQPNITAEWHTRIGAFKVNPACTAPQQGRLVVNVTNCDSMLPVRGASITVDNNLYGSTIANGSFGSQLVPGTYTVKVSGTNYLPVTINNVVITNGNTTTINQCILGVAAIDDAGATYTAESCAPADNALSPGETVTINFGLKNNGTASTANLVATLQSTGGVTSPSGPQNYGVIPPDNTTVVTRPFTFTADSMLTCGGIVTATFQVQDGATDLGTVTFTLQVGTVSVGSVTGTYSSGNIAVPIPDVSSVEVPINVPDIGAVDDVNVRVRLNHTFDGDLVISLVHPDNTIVNLSNNRGGSGANYGSGTNDCAGTPTVFDDEAAVTIASGTAPFAGTFRPDSPLSALDLKHTEGTWKLRISDTAALDVGTVGCVTLEIARRQFICCGVAGTPNIIAGTSTITAESISPANMAPDPGETITANLSLINTGTGDTTNLVATLQNSGGVTPVTTSANYGVVSTSGTPVSRPFTFVASGSCGSNITATLQLQDGMTNLGTVTFTFQLGTLSNSTTTFSNSAAITIPAGAPGTTTGPATPYPSNITVAGVTGAVSKVTVTLKTMNHTFPDDIDVLLVGPGGQKILLMSDAGGSVDIVNVNYTFDDAAASAMADGALNASGTYKPTNIGAGDTFPGPAPVGPYPDPQLLSVFNGVNPNGTWSLYIFDDVGGDVGNVNGGWELNLTTSQSICNTQTCSITCPANITVPPDSGQTSAVVNYAATPTGACGVLNYTPPSGSTFQQGTTTVNVTGANAAACSFTVTVTAGGGSTTGGIISEFRLRGPSGAQDEFIEIYNSSGAALTVAASDASAGWSVAASDGVVRCTIPNGTVIPDRGHFLCVNSVGYSLGPDPAGNGSTVTAGDATYTTDIGDNVGIALFNTANPANFNLANRLDAVGSATEANTLYKEGTGYPAVSTGTLNYSFFRNLRTGVPQDTNNNFASGAAEPLSATPMNDFVFADPSPTLTAAGQRLGAPGPENLSSPIQRNSTVKASLVSPCMSSSVAPNRVRTGTGNSGTLELRRKFTNNTGAPVTRLRFRIVDITSAPPAVGFADLRAVTSTSSNTDPQPCGGGTVNLTGLTLETPPTQAAGGGFNSTLSAGTITAGTPIAPGATINVNFLLNINQAGTFRFFVNVEALP